MDFEALSVANIGYKDRVDERDRELEKLRIKYLRISPPPYPFDTIRRRTRAHNRGRDFSPFRIAETVNGVAQYKEKEVCVLEDIELEEENLEECRKRNTEYRERLNKVHMRLNEIRDELHKRNISAGLLVARYVSLPSFSSFSRLRRPFLIPEFSFREELMEMQKMMVLKEQLKDKIATIKREIDSYEPAKQQLRRLVSTGRFFFSLLSFSKSIEEERKLLPYIYRLAYPIVAITDSFISRTVRDSRWNRIESIVRVHENFNPMTRSRPRIDRITEITRATYNYFSRINREIGSATNLFRKIYARSRHTFPPNSEPSFSKFSTRSFLFLQRLWIDRSREHRVSPFVETVIIHGRKKRRRKRKKRNERKNFSFDTGNQ